LSRRYISGATYRIGDAGIRIVLPCDDDSEFLDYTIYNDLAVGHASAEVRKRYHDICAKHIESDGIDSVILGCTELPLVISSDDLSIQVLDTTRTHVAAILAAAS
jgi:aspartate racemase